MDRSELEWRRTTNRLARTASSRVAGLWLQFAGGRLSRDEAVSLMAGIIAGAQRRAVTYNDLLLAAELAQRLDRDFDALGISWAEEPEAQLARLTKGIDTVLDADVAYANAGKTPEQRSQLAARSIRARLGRLTSGEVGDASQWARQEAMRIREDEGLISGWYRRLSADPCSFCRTLAGPGDPAKYVHPSYHRMATHKGCSCSQGIVTEIEPWQKWLGPSTRMRDLFPEGEVPGE